MKKLLSILLVLVVFFTLISTVLADDAEDEDTLLISAEELSDTISSQDEDEAFRTWAGACTAVISHMKNAAYDCIVGAYNYGFLGTVKKLMIAEDIWTVDAELPCNSSDHSFTDLNNAVLGYRNLKSYSSMLNELVAQKPVVPEKYAHIDAMITTAQSKLNECLDTYTSWTDPTDSRSAMDIWGIVEPLYWDSSVCTLIGLFYIDGHLGD